MLVLTLSAAAQESGGATSGGATSSAPSAPPEQPAPQQTYTPPPPPPAPEVVRGAWYVGLGGGWDGQNSISLSDSFGNTGKVSTNDGALLAGSLGYRFPAMPLRLEVEGGYTWHSLGQITINGSPATSASGHVNLGHVLFNAIYDVPIAPQWAISLGAGAGVGFGDYSMTAPFSGGLSKTGFMWQGIGGITYKWSPNLDLFVDYRYRDAQTGGDTPIAGGNVVHLHGITENAILAGFRWYM